MSAAYLSRAVAPNAQAAPASGVDEFRNPQDLVRGLIAGDERAAVALFDEYAVFVERTIARVMGVDSELSDAVQDAFMSALRTVHGIRDPQALPEWMRQVAVRTAVDWVRRRQRRRWLTVVDPDELVDKPDAAVSTPEREALDATYALLRRLSVDEQTVFALRHIEGLELTQIAEACGFSLATVKRRLVDADRRFKALATRHPTLSHWIQAASEEGK